MVSSKDILKIGSIPLNQLEVDRTYILYSIPIDRNGKAETDYPLREIRATFSYKDVKVFDKDTQDNRYWFKDLKSGRVHKFYATLYGITWYLRSET